MLLPEQDSNLRPPVYQTGTLTSELSGVSSDYLCFYVHYLHSILGSENRPSDLFCSVGGIRTHDWRIMSPLRTAAPLPRYVIVQATGFEPAMSTLKGW
jgi:hypothetical protein